MKRAQVHLSGNFIQIGLFFKMCIDIPDRLFYSLIICHDTKLKNWHSDKTRFLLNCDNAVQLPGIVQEDFAKSILPASYPG